MTYEALKRANEAMQLIDIKGKPYAQVHERVMAFRSIYPNGRIETTIERLDVDLCVIKATVKDEEGGILSTGYASENKNSSYINKTSYVENCETSAVGRALGLAGFGINAGIASAEEVTKAEAEQLRNKPIGKTKAKALRKRFETDAIDEAKVLALYKRNFLEDISETQLAEINEHYEQVKDRCGC